MRFVTHSLLLIAVAGCLTLAARADVFWRLPKTAGTRLSALGGSRMYATDVQVNGAPGTLAAFAFDTSTSQVSASLARRLKLPQQGVAAPGTAAMLTHAENGRLERYFVLPSPTLGGGCVVLAFDQSLRDAAKTGQAAIAWPAGIPAFAAEPLFTAVCAKTRATFVTAEAASSPEAAMQDAAQALRGAGWDEVPPSMPTFKIFVSGRKQSVLFANHGAHSERATISLLQREGATP